MRGDEIASRAVKRQPGLRVIFATGYEAPPRTVYQDGLHNAVLLQKPYDEQQIATALKAATSKTDLRQR
jgi:FixJ family two-component response regulator